MSNVFTSKTPKFSNFTREKHVNRDIFGKNMRMEDVLLIYLKQIAKDCLFTGQEQACTRIGPPGWHTCKKRVMLRRWLFWPKKFAEKVRKSRQNVNRDKSA